MADSKDSMPIIDTTELSYAGILPGMPLLHHIYDSVL